MAYLVEVWIENDVVRKRPSGGDFTVTGSGEALIIFQPKQGETGWIFHHFSDAAAQPGQPQGGKFTAEIHDDKIYLRDEVTGNGRSTYTITIRRGEKVFIIDPEIENRHEVGTPTVSPGTSKVN